VGEKVLAKYNAVTGANNILPDNNIKIKDENYGNYDQIIIETNNLF
jgi:hypothetical protein